MLRDLERAEINSREWERRSRWMETTRRVERAEHTKRWSTRDHGGEEEMCL